MDFIHVNKRPAHTSVQELIALANGLEVSGLDMFVRPGYPVEPEGVTRRLPEAIKQLDQASIKVQMVTAPADMTDPDDPMAQQIIAACGQVGVPLFKMGYFWPDGTPFWEHMDKIRKALQKFAKLARSHHVKVCFHTHFGCMGNSAAAAMHLVSDLDPQCIGVYLDTAHNHLAGEPIGLAIQTVGPHLAAIALKDVSYTVVDGRLTAKPHYPPAGDGVLDWSSIFEQIKTHKCNGPLSVHCEFNRDTPEEIITDLQRQIVFLRKTAAVKNT